MIENDDLVKKVAKDEKDEMKTKTNYREKLKNNYGLKKYRIQEVIKPGQVILIQVLKEERGQKGAALNYFYFFSWEIYGFNAKHSKRWRNIQKNF